MFRQFTIILVAIFVAITSTDCLAIGEKYSQRGQALYKSIIETLINKGICVDNDDCTKKVSIYGEDGNQVNVNMYSATDSMIVGAILGHVASDGLRITEGVPITVRVFREPKEKHLGFKAAFGLNKPAIILEVNN